MPPVALAPKTPPWKDEANPLGPPSVPASATPINAAALADIESRVNAALAQLLQINNSLSDVASASAARTALGLGSAATSASSAFDAAGAAATAQSNATGLSVLRDGTGMPASVVLDTAASPKDLDSTGVSNGQVPTYDSASGKYKPATPTAGGSGTSMAADITAVAYGCKGDGGTAADGAMSSGSSSLTTAAAASMTVGMKVYVSGAGASGGTLQTSVSTLVDATHVTLANTASATVSGKAVVYGTDNMAGLLAAANTGRTLFAPNPSPGSFYLFANNNTNSAFFQQPAAFLKIVGESREKVIFRLGPEGVTAQDCVLFQCNTGHTLHLENLTLQGQDFLGNGGPSADPGTPSGSTRNFGISHGGQSGLIKLINCRVRRFVFNVGINATSPCTTGIEAEMCHFEGYGSTYRSITLGAGEATGSPWTATKRVRCHGCRFSDFGDPTGGVTYHAIYTSTAWAMDIEQCQFHTPSPGSQGNAVQHFDQVISLANAAPVSRYTDCDFGPDLGLMSGILTSYNCDTEIVGCTFTGLEQAAIQIAGPTLISDCTFVQASDFGNVAIQTAPQGQSTGLTWSAQIVNCRFRGTNGANGPNCIRIGYTSATSDFKVIGCDFVGYTGSSAYVLIFGSGTVVGGKLEVASCRFEDNPGANIQADASSTAMRLSAHNNRFYTLDGTKCIKNSTKALASLSVRDNEFSIQTAGDAIQLSVTPALLDIDGNYGSTGFATRNGGASTSTPGAVTTVNIPHGLGNTGLAVTPTKISVEPGDANARGAPAFSRTATSTNIVLTFASALTAATAYTWQWWAER